MKSLAACVLTLLLVAGCGNTQSLAQREMTPRFDVTSYYSTAPTVDVGQCQGAMTISGGIKYKCTQ